MGGTKAFSVGSTNATSFVLAVVYLHLHIFCQDYGKDTLHKQQSQNLFLEYDFIIKLTVNILILLPLQTYTDALIISLSLLDISMIS